MTKKSQINGCSGGKTLQLRESACNINREVDSGKIIEVTGLKAALARGILLHEGKRVSSVIRTAHDNTISTYCIFGPLHVVLDFYSVEIFLSQIIAAIERLPMSFRIDRSTCLPNSPLNAERGS